MIISFYFFNNKQNRLTDEFNKLYNDSRWEYIAAGRVDFPAKHTYAVVGDTEDINFALSVLTRSNCLGAISSPGIALLHIATIESLDINMSRIQRDPIDLPEIENTTTYSDERFSSFI